MQTLSLEDVCKLLKISIKTGRNRIYQGLNMPPGFKVGKSWLFFEEEVKGWLERHSASPFQPNNCDKVVALGSKRGRPRKNVAKIK